MNTFEQVLNKFEHISTQLNEEDKVTDLTTLTRIMGSTGMYWAATGLEMG